MVSLVVTVVDNNNNNNVKKKNNWDHFVLESLEAVQGKLEIDIIGTYRQLLEKLSFSFILFSYF